MTRRGRRGVLASRVERRLEGRRHWPRRRRAGSHQGLDRPRPLPDQPDQRHQRERRGTSRARRSRSAPPRGRCTGRRRTRGRSCVRRTSTTACFRSSGESGLSAAWCSASCCLPAVAVFPGRGRCVWMAGNRPGLETGRFPRGPGVSAGCAAAQRRGRWLHGLGSLRVVGAPRRRRAARRSSGVGATFLELALSALLADLRVLLGPAHRVRALVARLPESVGARRRGHPGRRRARGRARARPWWRRRRCARSPARSAAGRGS